MHCPFNDLVLGVLVAQWVGHLTSVAEVVGLNPTSRPSPRNYFLVLPMGALHPEVQSGRIGDTNVAWVQFPDSVSYVGWLSLLVSMLCNVR